jgi:hypothetical protein
MIAGLDDVAGKIELAIESTIYNDTTHAVTMQVRLRNTSRDSIRAPLRVLVTRLTSQFGVPHVVGADNGGDGVGSVWDFTRFVPGGVLSPNGETQPRTLSFRLERAVGYERFVWAQRQSVVRFDARVFAQKARP